MKKTYLALLALFGAAAESLHAQVVVNGTLDTVDASYTDDFFGRRSSITISSSVAVPFAYDFNSTPSADTIQITWKAPVGKQFVLTAPVDFSTVYLRVYFTGGSVGANFVYPTGTGVEFGNLSGSLTQSDYFSSFTNLEHPSPSYNVYLTYDVSPGASVSFSSLTFSGTLGSELTAAFNSGGSQFSLEGSAQDGSGGDPGQWFRLEDVGGGVAVPEPSTYAAIAGGAALGLAAWKRRRRAANVA